MTILQGVTKMGGGEWPYCRGLLKYVGGVGMAILQGVSKIGGGGYHHIVVGY